MYMFFWFFKQLYYSLRRIFKSGILLLILFFIAFLFIFVKPTFAVELVSNVPGNSKTYNVPSLDTLSETYHNMLSNGFIINTYTYENHTYYALYISNGDPSFFYRGSSNTRITMAGGGYFTEFYPSWNSTSWGNGSTYKRTNSTITDTIYYGSNIYSNANKTSLFFTYTPPIVDPYITTDEATIINFSFNNLTIIAPDLPYDDYYELRFTYPNVNTIYTGSIDDFKTNENNTLVFNIPKSWFTNDIVVRSGSRISFDLIKYHRQEPAVTEETYSLGSYILDLTTQEQQEINEDSNKQVLSDISNNQKETTQAVENLENNLLNDTVPNDNEFTLPSVEVNDITSDFFTTLFNNLYNAITNANDTTITINLFSHTYTISSSQFNFLNDERFSVLSTFLQASWYGSIGFYIIYDIRKMIDKIKEGNIENISNNDIQANSV